MLPRSLVATLLTIVLAFPTGRGRAEEVVKVGIVLPMSGSFAAAGRQVLAGISLFVQQHGDSVAGKKIQLIVKDDASIPGLSKRIAQELIITDHVAAPALSASITRAGIWRKVLEFVRLPLPLLRVGRGRFFDHNIWPDSRVFRIQRQPFLKPRLGVRLDRVDRAFRHADPAIDAFVRVDDEHVLALVKAVHGAHVDAVHDFAANTALVDDEGQLSVLSADRRRELIHNTRPSSRCSFMG